MVITNELEVNSYCKELLCINLNEKTNQQGKKKFGFIELSYLKAFKDVTPKLDIQKHVRAYLLYILGCLIFPRLLRMVVALDYLKLLEDTLRVDEFA